MHQKGILNHVRLPQTEYEDDWNKIFVAEEIKTRLLSQAVLSFTVRGKVSATAVPLHGIILLVGPPGTGKTTLARGLANRVAQTFGSEKPFHFITVEPHSLASSGLGRSQQAVRDLLQNTIAEHASQGPLIVLLDEVETLAPDRRKMSLEANPVDVHRATDAVLASVDQLAADHPRLLFIATSNFTEAIDGALLSRADLIQFIDKPDKEACQAILLDTLSALAKVFPRVVELTKAKEFETAVLESVGLDGREIRKAVIGACTYSKEVALDPNRMKVADLIRSIQHKKKANPS